MVLRNTQLKRKHKLGLSAILSLSTFMIVLAIVRIAGGQTLTGYSHVWEFRWLYMEACVACFMASISAFRSLFVPSSSRAWMKKPGRPSTYTRQQIWKKFKDPARRRWSLASRDLNDELPAFPLATLIRTPTSVGSDNGTSWIEPLADSSIHLLEDMPRQNAPYKIEADLEKSIAIPR